MQDLLAASPPSEPPLLRIDWGRISLSHMSLELAHSASLSIQLALWVPCICLLNDGVIGRLSHLPDMFVVACSLNSGPHAYAVTTEPSFQPARMSFRVPLTSTYSTCCHLFIILGVWRLRLKKEEKVADPAGSPQNPVLFVERIHYSMQAVLLPSTANLMNKKIFPGQQWNLVDL